MVTAAAVASITMPNTGIDSAAEWSPDHVGEPEEDFPLFTLVHNLILRPIGVTAPAQPLPGDRATFYVPRSDDNNPRRGRRLMYMRDLACCADGMAFFSTPSDLVRFAMTTEAERVNGQLAGGSVMSLMTSRDSAIVVALTSNVAHANTAALTVKAADVFAEQRVDRREADHAARTFISRAGSNLQLAAARRSCDSAARPACYHDSRVRWQRQSGAPLRNMTAR